MSEGGHEAVRADEEVVPISRVRELENKVRELERLLGRKTMETEIRRDALAVARPEKKPWLVPSLPKEIPGEGRRRHAQRRPLQPGGATEAARSPAPGRRTGFQWMSQFIMSNAS